MTQCKYKRIGCPWHGPFHELTVHEAACAHPTKTGNELMEILDEMDQSHRKEMQLYNSIFSLLSFEKIGYTGEAPHGPLHATQADGGCGRWEPGEQWALSSEHRPCWMARLWTSFWRMGGHLGGEDVPEAEQGMGRGRTPGAPAWLSEALSPVLPSPALPP